MARNDVYRYRGAKYINSNTNPDRKPYSEVSFSTLRRMAVAYPIARACINRRIRQITGLQWEISTIDEIDGENGNEEAIKTITEFFKHPTGPKSRTRQLLTVMVDDILTLDAVCLEKSKLLNGEFNPTGGLIPVDPTTIALRVEESGATPLPPEPAYAQIIQGHIVDEFTTDEMVYDMLGARSYSPYGLAPLESLILQVESAIRGALYNLNYLRESNVPEGIVTLPDDVATTTDAVREWQEWFDAICAGDSQMMHRLKIMPGGSEYVPTKKPEDMAFERFELWLLQQTCAVFDVPPQDIGITYQVNKSTGEQQNDLSKERGLQPLANILKEVFDGLIQFEMGYPNLQFNWMNLSPVDRKEEVEVAEKEINMGALSVDEYRIAQGLEPIGLEAYVKGGGTPILVSDLINGTVPGQQQFDANGKPVDPNAGKDKTKPDDSKKKGELMETEQDDLEQQDIKAWRKCIYTDIALDRPLRKNFVSEYIKSDTRKLIQEGLEGVSNKLQAKLFFDQFLDKDVRSAMKMLKIAENMRRIEHAYIADE